jgi:hypothetical protein
MALHAQQDSIQLSNKLTDTTDVKYNRLYQQFITEKEKPILHLWKLDIAGSGILMPALSYEKKLGKNWSMDTYLKFGLPWKEGYFAYKPEWEINQQFRFYYSFNRRAKLGKNINGFSGNYFALEILGGEKYQPKPGVSSETIVDGNHFIGTGLRFGIQRRVGTFGYIEPFVSLRYLYGNVQTSVYNVELNKYNNASFYNRGFSYTIGLTAGFDLDNLSLQDNSTDSKAMFKLNLTSLGFFHGNLGFEHYLWPKWTLNTYVAGGLNEWFAFDSDDMVFESFGKYYFPSFEIEQQIRFYPRKSISHFSGIYTALEISGRLKTWNYLTENQIHQFDRDIRLRNYGLSAKIGLQRIVARNGYIDLFAGLKYESQEYPLFRAPEGGWPGYTIRTRNHFVPVIGLRAGFAISKLQKNR